MVFVQSSLFFDSVHRVPYINVMQLYPILRNKKQRFTYLYDFLSDGVFLGVFNVEAVSPARSAIKADFQKNISETATGPFK